MRNVVFSSGIVAESSQIRDRYQYIEKHGGGAHSDYLCRSKLLAVSCWHLSVKGVDTSSSVSASTDVVALDRRYLQQIDTVLNIDDSHNTGIGTVLGHSGLPAKNFADQYGGAVADVASTSYADLERIHRQVELANTNNPNKAASKWQDSLILMVGGGWDVFTPNGLTWAELAIECAFQPSLVSLLFGCQIKPDFRVENFSWDEAGTKYREFFGSMADMAGNSRLRVFGYGRLLLASGGRGWDASGRFLSY